jgi:hypothetical protein
MRAARNEDHIYPGPGERGAIGSATCKSCGACAEPREAVIGFPAHGPWRLVEKATAARDVPVGESWAFREHRTMAEVIAQEKPLTA